MALCSSGIVIRVLAPLLEDKRSEPPVVAVAEDGSVAVPLLGGHRGANRLARRIAAMLGCPAAITTAGDARFELALDDPPPGWRVHNPETAKAIISALLEGRDVALKVEAGAARLADRRRRALCQPTASSRCASPIAPIPASATRLVIHPKVLALGVGCERGVAPEELLDLVSSDPGRAMISPPGAIACVVSLDLKAAEPAIHALAAQLGVPARFFPAARLEAETARLANPSAEVFAVTGCHGVAEGAALAAVGPEGELVVAKTRSARATCAIARAPAPLDPARIGRPQGRLAIVGLGPGGADWRTPEASALLDDAEDWVGYAGYLDSGTAAAVAAGRSAMRFALGEEEARVRRALDLAARRPPGRADQLGRPRHLRHGGAGVRAAGARRRARLAARGGHGQPRRLGAAGRGGARRRTARPRLLRDLAVRSADAVGRDRAAAGGGGGRRLRARCSTTPPPAGAARALRARSRSCARRDHPRPPSCMRATSAGPGRRWRSHRSPTFDPERGGHAEPADRRLEPDAHVCRARWPHARVHAARLPSCRPAHAMTVHFIGAGPGAPDLITVRGLRLIRSCPVVLYAGSLVPREVVAQAGEDTPLAAAHHRHRAARSGCDHRRDRGRAPPGLEVARVHSGDPSFYGAIGEQMRRLRQLGIPYDVTPGVPAFAAAAAALAQELTLPGVAQSVVLTRTAVRASAMPAGETLAAFAATGATLAIHLSINNLARVVRELGAGVRRGLPGRRASTAPPGRTSASSAGRWPRSGHACAARESPAAR